MAKHLRRLFMSASDASDYGSAHYTSKQTMKVLVVYHTTYGHTLQLARAVEEGVKSVAGVEAVFRRAPEFPHVEKELEGGEGYAAKIWKEQKDIQPCTLDELREADGLLLGSPTRYGNMDAAMK